MSYTTKQMQHYMQSYREQVKEEIYSKLGGKCVVCGSTEELEIDHIDPEEKSFSIARNWTRKKVQTLTELSKCQLMCKTHHDIKTQAYWASKRQHGKVHTYRKWGCRCEACTKAYVDNYKSRDRRTKTKQGCQSG